MSNSSPHHDENRTQVAGLQVASGKWQVADEHETLEGLRRPPSLGPPRPPGDEVNLLVYYWYDEDTSSRPLLQEGMSLT